MKINQIAGIIIGGINLLWIIHFAYYFFAYRFTNILWLVMIPDWILITNITIGFIGLFASVMLFGNRLKMKFLLIIEFVLLPIGLFLLLLS